MHKVWWTYKTKLLFFWLQLLFTINSPYSTRLLKWRLVFYIWILVVLISLTKKKALFKLRSGLMDSKATMKCLEARKYDA